MGVFDLLKKGLHDVDAVGSAAVHTATRPFSQPVSTVQQAQPKPVVQTPGPAIQVHQFQAPKLSVPTFQPPNLNISQPSISQPALKPAAIAQPQVLQVGNRQIMPSPQAKTNAQVNPNELYKTNAQKFLASKPGTVGLGALRSAQGTAQGLSGLADLVTPGTGTNRFSQALNRTAQTVDRNAQGSNQLLYKGAQLGTDLATLSGGGESKLATKIPLVERAVKPLIDDGNLAQRLAGRGIKAAANPTLQLGNAGFTALQTGKEASQGKNINPLSVLAQGAVGGIGLPLAGAAAHEALSPALLAAERGIRDAGVLAPSRLNPDEIGDLSMYRNARGTYNMTDDLYNRGQLAAQKAGIDAQNPGAIDDLLNAHQNYATQRLNMKSPAFAQGGYVKNPLSDTADSAAKSPTPELLAKEPAIPTELPGQGTLDTSLAQNTPQVAQNRLTRGAQEGRQNVSPEIGKQVSGEHTVRNTAELADNSTKAVEALSPDDAIGQAHDMLAQPLGHVNDEQTGFITKAIEKADSEAARATAAGDLVNADRFTREATALHDGLSEHAVARGQANQALVMLYNQTPQGMLYRAVKDLTRAGVKDSPELRAKLQPLVDAIKTSTNPEQKIEAIARFHQAVSKEMPQGISDKLTSIWKAGLLSGIKTHEGNIISNTAFKVAKKISDVPSVAADKAISLVTGKRTVALTQKGEGKGGVEGLKNAGYTLKTGIDKRNISTSGGKYEQHAEVDFNNPVIDKTVGKAVRGVFRVLGAADQPFWYSSFKNSMYDQAKAEGLTKKLRGKQLSEFMDSRVKDPSPQMAETALKDANKATLGYDTIGSRAVQGIHTAIDKAPGVSEAGKSAANAVVNVLAPFVRVPTAFISRTVDFTPLGIGKEVTSQLAHGKFDQRALSQAIGEGSTGTGIIALGVGLAQKNLLSGNYPQGDPKEAQRWKAEGIQPNAVKVGNKWISLNYLGPVGLLFNAGKQIHDAGAKGESELGKAFAAAGGLGQGLLGQSFLQGFSGFTNAITDPQRSAKSFINSEVGSVVPSALNDIANVTDKFQRQADTAGETIKNRIPGLRETNPIKTDVYGNQLKQAAGQANTLNGLKPSDSLTGRNDVIKEVSRLRNVDTSNKDLEVTPTTIDKKLKVDGIKLTLNDKQRNTLQASIGQRVQSAWNDAIKSDVYKGQDDTGKADMLNNIRQDATNLAEREYASNTGNNNFTKQVSSREDNLANGQVDYSNYVSNGSGSAHINIAKNIDQNSKQFLRKYSAMSADQRTKAESTQNDFDYNYAVAKYQNDKANHKLSTAQDIKAKDAIDKAKAGKDYSKEVRDLYGLSKGDIYDYVSTSETGKDKKKLADQLIAYGDALANATGTKSKFRNSKGDLVFSSDDSKKASTKKKTAKASTAGIKAGDYSGSATLAHLSSTRLAARKGSSSGGKVALRSIQSQVKNTGGKTQKRMFV